MWSVLAPTDTSTLSNQKYQVPNEFKFESPSKSNRIIKKRGISTEKEDNKIKKQDVDMGEKSAPIVPTGAYASYTMFAGLLTSSRFRRCHSRWRSVRP